MYDVPLVFKNHPKATILHVCSCEEMETARGFLDGFNSLLYAKDMCVGPGMPLGEKCLHIEAYERLCLHDLPLLVSREEERLCLLKNSTGSPLVISAANLSSSDMFTRVLLGTNAENQYICHDAKCKRYKKHCEHLEILSEALDDTGQYADEPYVNYSFRDETFQATKQKPVEAIATRSTTKLSLMEMSPRMQRRLSFLPVPWLPGGLPRCIPTCDGVCTCGAKWNHGDPVTNAWITRKNATLYGQHSSKRVTVYYRPCTVCDARKGYDGYEDGVFNYSDESLFLHETMFGYINSFAKCNMTFYAYHAIMETQYVLHGETPCSTNTITSALHAFIQLLDIDYKAGYGCPVCTNLPPEDQVVCMDGKDLGFPRNRTRDYGTPVISDDSFANHNTMSFAYIRHCKDNYKNLLKKYIHGTLDDKDHSKLLRLVKKHNAELETLVKDFPCPKSHRRFLASITTDYPIDQLIHTDLAYLLRGILDSREFSPIDRRHLQVEWPALYELLVETGPYMIWEHESLFNILIDKAREGTRFSRGRDLPVDLGGADDYLTFMPNHQRCRPMKRCKHNKMENLKCTKHIKRNKNLTPGLFALFCPHGICIGFHVMAKFEGPMTAFEVLYTRFEEPPGIVIYDNACALSRVCKKMAPAHFDGVKFFIDRVHWPGHIGCHEGYCMDTYKSKGVLGGAMTLAQVNSQVCEQGNSKLEVIATQTKFMNQDNYTAYVKLFFYLCNQPLIRNVVAM